MHFQTTTYALCGLRPRKVTVEVDVEEGQPAFAVQGLPDGTTEATCDLLRSALGHAGFTFPEGRRTKVRLTPMPLLLGEVDGLALAMAVGILGASDQLARRALGRVAVTGALREDGTIGPIRGALQIAEAVAENPQLDSLVVASASAPEAACAVGVEVLQLHSLSAARYLADQDLDRLRPEPRELSVPPELGALDFASLPGCEPPRRAAEVAAAGDHSLLLAAPVGAGQSLVAHRIPSILPPLRRPEALEVLRIASAEKEQGASPATGRPFRSTGPSTDLVAVLGGGHPVNPGEVSLAHNGVLYLNDLAAFDPEIVEAVANARLSRSTYVGSPPEAMPCAFFLIASTALCPCGSFAAPDRLCSCAESDLAQHRHRLAIAAENFDMVSTYGPPTTEDLAAPTAEPSCAIRSRVMEARARQAARLGEGRTNRQMSAGETEVCGLSAEAVDAINRTLPYPHLAGRRLRVAQVARTVADLGGSEQIDTFHVAEAIDLQFDRRPQRDPAAASQQDSHRLNQVGGTR